SGANMTSAVPCVGYYVGWIVWTISAILMLRQAQRVATWRAILAAAGPPLLSVVAVGIAYAVFLMNVISVSSVAMVATTAPAHAPAVQAVARAVVSYSGQHGGRGPRHVAELLWAGELLPTDLVSSGSNDDVDKIMIGQMSVGSLEQVPLQLRSKLIEPFVRSQPAGRQVYRFGRCIFAP